METINVALQAALKVFIKAANQDDNFNHICNIMHRYVYEDRIKKINRARKHYKIQTPFDKDENFGDMTTERKLEVQKLLGLAKPIELYGLSISELYDCYLEGVFRLDLWTLEKSEIRAFYDKPAKNKRGREFTKSVAYYENPEFFKSYGIEFDVEAFDVWLASGDADKMRNQFYNLQLVLYRTINQIKIDNCLRDENKRYITIYNALTKHMKNEDLNMAYFNEPTAYPMLKGLLLKHTSLYDRVSMLLLYAQTKQIPGESMTFFDKIIQSGDFPHEDMKKNNDCLDFISSSLQEIVKSASRMGNRELFFKALTKVRAFDIFLKNRQTNITMDESGLRVLQKHLLTKEDKKHGLKMSIPIHVHVLEIELRFLINYYQRILEVNLGHNIYIIETNYTKYNIVEATLQLSTTQRDLPDSKEKKVLEKILTNWKRTLPSTETLDPQIQSLERKLQMGEINQVIQALPDHFMLEYFDELETTTTIFRFSSL